MPRYWSRFCLQTFPTQTVDVVVRSFVPEADLTEGVWVAWGMLAGLGVFLVIVAVVAADRLGRSVVRPVGGAIQSCARFSVGETSTGASSRPAPMRSPTLESPSISWQSGCVCCSLRSESRLPISSHRLRTPLTALRLQAETLGDQEAGGGIAQ